MRRHAFWIGSVLVLAGVFLHVPSYLMSAEHNFRMAHMDMGLAMSLGMVLLVVGTGIAVWGLLPPRAVRTTTGLRFGALDEAPLSRAHKLLVLVLFVALVIDTMKPASLGFTVPGMAAEYGLTKPQVAMFPFVALCGTVAGSILWGYLGDVIGRRATILLSALMYVGTAVCGFMPSFGWNMVMCFAMGLSAGGLLPIVYALMSETMPAKHRGWLLVLQSGLGAAAGYLVASGAATLLVPLFSWRSLWLLGLPTGLLLIVLSRWIPESPRFLIANGRDEEAAVVMARYGVRAVPADAPVALEENGSRVRTLLGDAYRLRTVGILSYGLGWGIINWGFVTFLPIFLEESGVKASRMLFIASLLALPATAVAAWLYARWSSRGSMLVYCAGSAASLVLFAVVGAQSGWLFIALVSGLLACFTGMVAMLSPYAAEVYPTSLRATGSGFAAASTKAGGLLGPVLVTTAPALESVALICAAPAAIAAFVLWRTGMETTGKPLVEASVG
ncbi:MFS transporter [Lentzea sp. NBRC 105346]|uniref:MFS transporter n=1 Tax=Lentzea sp. NBRC 105346 TaxID=3032205 RepID=UPI00249FBAEF|nr:MFS transporter [Lentzea sp. NBRC 105346]GLZ35216.1 MFS transporter [Lentzea sp. NBRC 105346]